MTSILQTAGAILIVVMLFSFAVFIHEFGHFLAARKLGAAPADCTVFEDSAAGVAAGKAAGMRVVALKLPDHPPQDLSAADLVLDDLSKFVP